MGSTAHVLGKEITWYVFSFDEIMLDSSSMDGLPLRDQDQGQAPSQKPLQESRQKTMVMCTTALVKKVGSGQKLSGDVQSRGDQKGSKTFTVSF